MSETEHITLDDIERGAYESTGRTESFEMTTEQLRTISHAVSMDARDAVANSDFRAVACQALWELSDDDLRVRVATGSIATQTWPARVPASSERELYFDRPSRLAEAASVTSRSELAATSLVAVVNQYRARIRYVPGSTASWAAATARLHDETGQRAIAASLGRLRFSDHHIDSEDMSDPHRVGQYLSDDSLSVAFRQQLLGLAVADIHRTTYKPGAWRSQLEVTLKRIADDTENPLRFNARKELSMPETDVDYAAMTVAQQTEREREQDEERVRRAGVQAQRELVLQNRLDLLRLVVGRVLN